MVATRTDVDDAPRPRPGALHRRGDRGAVPRPGRRADAVRQQPDPPEPARARRARSRCGSSTATAIGVASTNRLDEAGIRGVVAAAAAIAERSAPNPRAAIIPEPRRPQHDPELGYVAATAEAGAERTRRGRPRGDRRRPGGGPRDGRLVRDLGDDRRRRRTRTAFAPSTARRGRPLLTVMMDGFASGAASGYAQAGSPDVGDIDADALGAEAAEKGDRMRGADELEAGEYEVILEEYAVAGLMEYLSLHRLLAASRTRRVARSWSSASRSWATTSRSGTTAPIRPACPRPIDFEGVVRQRVDLIERRRRQGRGA